jgi:pyruvate,orthophosphate dikinase
MKHAHQDHELEGAIGAVFNSWMNERAIIYRQKYRIPDEWGTAVNVQSMVFGNMGDDCATGVAFTRDPLRANVFLRRISRQRSGRGRRRRRPHAEKDREMADDKTIGAAFKEGSRSANAGKNFGDVQDFEFTIEKKLFMLQTRNGKRTALAYVKIAHDMVKEKLMTPEHAIKSGDPEALNQLLQPIFDRDAYAKAKKEGRLMATGLPAGPGAASGSVVFGGEGRGVGREGKHVCWPA